MPKPKKPERTEFIEDLRFHISHNIPGMDPGVARKHVDRWCSGEAAKGPVEKAVFDVCDRVKQDIDAMP